MVIVFNRDEAMERPSLPMQFWDGEVLAGRDVLGNGTWLGVSRSGRFAAILNYWESGSEKERQGTMTLQIGAQAEGFMTRGEIPLRLLDRNNDMLAVAQDLWQSRHRYKSFNLVFGSLAERRVWHCSHNYSQAFKGVVEISDQLFSVSNTSFQVRWEKTEKMKQMLGQCLSGCPVVEPSALFGILANRDFAERIPDVHPAEHSIFVPTFEKVLNHLQVNKGTVSSTLILIDRSHTVTVHERSYTHEQTQHTDVMHRFQAMGARL